MQKYGVEEISNLAKVIESSDFADHAGGFMDQLRQEFAAAHGAKHAITAATAMLNHAGDTRRHRSAGWR